MKTHKIPETALGILLDILKNILITVSVVILLLVSIYLAWLIYEGNNKKIMNIDPSNPDSFFNNK